VRTFGFLANCHRLLVGRTYTRAPFDTSSPVEEALPCQCPRSTMSRLSPSPRRPLPAAHRPVRDRGPPDHSPRSFVAGRFHPAPAASPPASKLGVPCASTVALRPKGRLEWGHGEGPATKKLHSRRPPCGPVQLLSILLASGPSPSQWLVESREPSRIESFTFVVRG